MRKYRRGLSLFQQKLTVIYIGLHVLKSQVLLPVRWNVSVDGHRRSTAVAGLVEHTGWKAIWNFQLCYRNHTQILSVCSLPSKASDFLHVDMSVLKGNSSCDDKAEHDGCPICNLAFNLSTNTPRVLHCGHCICTFCLETALIKGDLEIMCFPCNTVTTLVKQPLPLCHSTMHMLNNEALQNLYSYRLSRMIQMSQPK